MSQTNNSNLIGWAAIITAFASLITAIGFPSLFPDLARQLWLKDNSTTENQDINSQNGKGNSSISTQKKEVTPNPISTKSKTPSLDWSDTAKSQEISNKLDQDFPFICPPGGGTKTIYGTDIYTSDSSICTAAIHSGLINAKYGGQVTILIQGVQDSYLGSKRNGVESRRWGKYGESFTFIE